MGPVNETEGDDVCPYLGSAPFEAARADLFFGRTRAVEDVLKRLAPRPDGHGAVLLVSGASGVGTSSLLRAGVLPALAAGAPAVPGARDRPRLLVTPGEWPLAELATAWAAEFGGSAADTERVLREEPGEPAPGVRPVLVVDRFEELFTLVTDEAERQAYATALNGLATGRAAAEIIIGLRTGSLDRAAAYPQIAQGFQDGPVTVEPMTESDLRLAITGPAAATGLELEPGLVETILGDLRIDGSHGAGALPLLSRALHATWERREDGRLTVRGYQESGHIPEAVLRAADAVLDELPDEGRTAALRMFRRLVRIVGDGRAVARAATLAELRAAASVHSGRGHRPGTDELVALLADRRLLTLDGDHAEITHAVLASGWPALRRWNDPDLTVRAVYDRLIQDAEEWGEHHDSAYLYRGARLLAVRDAGPRWDRDRESFPPPGATVDAFLSAARRAERGRRLAMAGVVVLALVALAAIARIVWP